VGPEGADALATTGPEGADALAITGPEGSLPLPPGAIPLASYLLYVSETTSLDSLFNCGLLSATAPPRAYPRTSSAFLSAFSGLSNFTTPSAPTALAKFKFASVTATPAFFSVAALPSRIVACNSSCVSGEKTVSIGNFNWPTNPDLPSLPNNVVRMN
jgi:hypothetical protein